MEFGHVSLVVSDRERSLEWWERSLGIDPAEAGVALVEGEPCVLPNDRVGGMHICLQVPDVDESYRRLLANGVTPSTPPRELIPGVRSLYFREPDGIQLQLIERQGASALHHVAYSVSDLEATIAWYGLEPSYRASATGPHIQEMLETAAESYDVALLPLGDLHLELMQWEDRTPSGEPTWQLVLRGADGATLLPPQA
jgi:catechol 2,3-dioxygenase-like lactoylglutathione lyase family enzyme